MTRTPLSDLREHVECLASETGEYAVVCARTGERPVPVADHRFDSRAVARDAARTAERYRARLRRYDPRVAVHDLVVCRQPDHGTSPDAGREPQPGEVA